jgi:cellulose synthase (UDP-forming)
MPLQLKMTALSPTIFFSQPIMRAQIYWKIRLRIYRRCVPYPGQIKTIYLCDDGNRDGSNPEKPNLKELAARYGAIYLSRNTNKGFKAGNLNNAFWQSSGDFIVIVDADTRLFPDFLIKLTGYFRDRKMAWVQSPQWFYDIDEGTPPKGSFWTKLISAVPFLRSLRMGKNLLGTDPELFYDVILRHRNAANAAFCCGAGSIHRRKALLSLVEEQKAELLYTDSTLELPPNFNNQESLQSVSGQSEQLIGPFVHHISEDLFTSLLLHRSKSKWKSWQHSTPLCKMLSPQDLPAYEKQFSRYAEGTFSITFSRFNPLWIRGLSLRQRLAYFETIYSYFSPIWLAVFLLSPAIFYLTLVPPIKAFNFDFFLRFIAINLANQALVTVANWGKETGRSEQYYISGFWLKLRALIKVISGRQIRFNTTHKGKRKITIRQKLKPVLPHLIILFLYVLGLAYNIVLLVQNAHPSYSAFLANTVWAGYNAYQILPMIRAALKL